jgi:hypothetical protein
VGAALAKLAMFYIIFTLHLACVPANGWPTIFTHSGRPEGGRGGGDPLAKLAMFYITFTLHVACVPANGWPTIFTHGGRPEGGRGGGRGRGLEGRRRRGILGWAA